ncbi:glycosyltransferase family 2 protein [Galbitalea soli]|uniref:Glycosyltransferase n=1 Tax=Galbitalea soli TaxID=1268042 RepID=A0A7C9PL37_9MICO|nr:glycosyltransferase family 2 protein [Galbitalea soli]NEM89974.1 glycosyltransferase [Galbitalea soli]NYJ30680.1 GT2 family glycosyltransferase [Galbitalea soli]
MTAPERPRILLVSLTFKRPEDLRAILPKLVEQAESVDAEVEILIVDNDPDGGAEDSVRGFAGTTAIVVSYVHEPHPGIVAARNRALAEAAHHDILVFIDDDERPLEGWLDHLLETWRRYSPAAVVGAVISEYASEPDPWLAAGRFFDRRRLPTGTPITVFATNNLLLDLRRVRAAGVRFDERFGLTGGSDTLFSRQLAARGGALVWCDEAVVVDMVPDDRLTRSWVLRRAYRSGNSWTRTSLALEVTALGRLRVRASVAPRGFVRVLGGSVQAALGRLTGSLSHQARGARTRARGAGMLAGAVGSVYAEYRRD